ncbi:extracellular guanyl-specific ribonuclease fl2 [Fusarium longipes]|uniref:Extracellular guanyl-specific ribonuclease fl2 n=1 Tax=Fusarium longipes TaxID=694270 RepID=A0A395SAK7_9HYPO|nr:extracellular guanyl-specific ribonuclease fl2 [Fusarium longipes]
MSLTFAALAEHTRQNTAMSVSPPSSPQLDDDNSSECSYYSLVDLENDRWYRNIPASQIQEQAKQVPSLPAPANAQYPRMLHNKEQLELASRGPWTEYPFCLNKRYIHGTPGPVRIIVNSANSDEFDVVYHPQQQVKAVCLAKYRPKGYSKGACPKPLPYNPLPTNNSSGISNEMTYHSLENYYYPPAPLMAAQTMYGIQTTYDMQIAMHYSNYIGVNPYITTPGQLDAGYATNPYANQCAY